MRTKTAAVLFGPPGSGKGTQAVLLADCLELPHISTGDIFRAHVQAGDELGSEVRAIMNAGKLVPDELANRIVENRIRKPDCANGFILDGYPRTIPQAKALDRWLTDIGMERVVVNLVVDYDVIARRIAARRSCPLCGSSYNLISNPPREDTVCDRDGTALVAREDDREAVLRKRFEAYEQQTTPLLGYFRSSGVRFYDVDGNTGSPESIANRVCELVAETVQK